MSEGIITLALIYSLYIRFSASIYHFQGICKLRPLRHEMMGIK
jgi:hypothetical protein